MSGAMEVLFYKRPQYINHGGKPLDHTECERYLGRAGDFKDRVPAELSFENVIENKAMPPCSLQDFFEFLRYVEHDAENLQFYFWLQDYTRRFFSLRRSEQALSPEWDSERAPAPPGGNVHPVPKSGEGIPVNFDEPQNPFADQSADDMDVNSFIAATVKSTRTMAETVSEAHTAAGLKWQPFSIQPFRDEITKIVAHYIAPGSPRELNLSHRDRAHVLHALQHTSHPSAFARVKDIVDTTLRRQSHPNFIRYSICNSNMPRVMFARIVGGLNILTGVLVGLLIALTKVSRWWRITVSPLVWLGAAILIASIKGLCLILQVTHSLNVKPWVAYADDDEASLHIKSPGGGGSRNSGSPHDDEITLTNVGANKSQFDTLDGKPARPRDSFDTWGTSNDFGHEAWVGRYKRQNIVRKVFDKQVWIQNDHVRFMQDKIAYQSVIWAVVVTIPLVVAVTAIPNANKF